MATTVKILWGLVFLGIICGAIALAKWGIPAPTVEVTKVFSTDQFVK
ncbi:MAG: hypothetical protein ACPGXY_00670 [Alphaproteobacteria bacterium]